MFLFHGFEERVYEARYSRKGKKDTLERVIIAWYFFFLESKIPCDDKCFITFVIISFLFLLLALFCNSFLISADAHGTLGVRGPYH